MQLHTIIGAGGAVSNELVKVLLQNSEQVRLVSRKALPVAGTESLAADVTDAQQTLNAVSGSSVVYLLVGLQYDVRVWKESWPKIMRNVIDACKSCGARLIFFDNVYMYGKVDGWMTEETPFKPCSKKGEIRAAIANLLLTEVNAGNIKATIARSADFYGPVGYNTSVPNMLVFANLKKGKKSQWLANAKMPHSFTYVPDAAKALYILATSEKGFTQKTWHLPTDKNALTGEEFIQLAAEAMHGPKGYSILPVWMMRLAGLFNRAIKESVEMAYQSAYPYYFDSTKFNTTFGFVPTTYKKGIELTAEWALKD